MASDQKGPFRWSTARSVERSVGWQIDVGYYKLKSSSNYWLETVWLERRRELLRIVKMKLDGIDFRPTNEIASTASYI